MYGYAGKILHVYLDDGRLEVETPSEEFYRKYVGGTGFGLYYLLKHTPKGADPLGPENTLVFSVSGPTGAPISGQSRLTVNAKSPLTGAVGDAQAGGFFPAEMKFAGFDAFVFHGKSPKPVYLWVKDGQAELRDASHLWGKVTGEVEAILKEELGDRRIEVAQIGPAGENLVRFAAIMNMSNRANGRTGMGAVMGSKNLKAVVVRGNKKSVQFAHVKEVGQLARWGAKEFPDSDVYGLGLLGTAEIVRGQNKGGGLPTHNWDSGYFACAENISGHRMADTILKERDTCYACTVRCKRVVEVDNRYKVDPFYGGPEYETLATFGSYCNIDDLEAIAYANQLCNMYGMDTISCGATIAWAMDAFEHGYITAKDTDGVCLTFGNAEAMVQMVEKIAKREGFGDILAEGSARAAEKFGEKAQDLVVAVKKQEMPAHMPQVKRSLGLIYAVNPYGADHQSSEHDPSWKWYPERMAMLGLGEAQPNKVLNKEKVNFALTTEKFYMALNTFNICQFVFGPAWHLYGPDQLAELVKDTLDWDLGIEGIQEVGERTLNMLRAFNAREGFTRSDDSLPKKLYKPLKGGRSEGIHLTPEELEQAKDWYYEMAGWDENGVPTREKLAELGLEWVAEQLQ